MTNVQQKKEQRNVGFCFMLTPTEKQRIVDAATQTGMAQASLVRYAILSTIDRLTGRDDPPNGSNQTVAGLKFPHLIKFLMHYL